MNKPRACSSTVEHKPEPLFVLVTRENVQWLDRDRWHGDHHAGRNQPTVLPLLRNRVHLP